MNRRPMILFSAAVVAAMILLSAWAWTQLPAGAQVPIHWGLDGRVDAYAPRRSACSLLPVLTIGIAAVLRRHPALRAASRQPRALGQGVRRDLDRASSPCSAASTS